MGGARVEDFCAPRHSYVVDENHRVVYLDGVSKKLFPQASLGCLCYDALRGGTHPCPDCPLTKRALEHDALNQNLVYNHNLRQWIALCSLAIEWPNCGTCTLISAKGLDENDKDLFHIFSQQASYDELFEINISEKTYKALYRAKAKYLTPPLSGSLENRLLELSNAIIHPDDRQQFLDFWNIDNIESLLAQTGMRKHEFRVKLNKGGYGWTSQTTIPVQRGERDTTALMCFVVDIDEQRQEEERVRNNEATSSRQLVAERDVLTGLYTTFAFLDRTEKHLVDNAHEPFDLLYIDIDH
ncbi:MAG: hypothetical protein RR773_02745, partial [Raoultibacter sp.]